MHSALTSLASFIGRVVETDRPLIIFDWSAIPSAKQRAFLDEIFGDWDDQPAFAKLVTKTKTGIEWSNERLVPFALSNVESTAKAFKGGASFPQFDELLLADVKASSVPVFALAVDGTAVDGPLRKVSSSLVKLGVGVEKKAAPVKKAGAKDSKATMKRDAPLANAVENAIGSFVSNLRAYRFGLHGIQYGKAGFKDVKPNKTAAAAAQKKCESSLKRLENALAATSRFAELGAGNLVTEYRALFERVAKQKVDDAWWKRFVANRTTSDEKYFRKLAADLHHIAVGTSWWPAKVVTPYGAK